MRVRWKHDCPMEANGEVCLYNKEGGETWIPKYANKHEDFYEAAKALGLTADAPPDKTRGFAMVAWKCRPGVLQVHYLDELEEIAPPVEVQRGQVNVEGK